MDWPSVSVIILNWNARKMTEKCVDSLLDITDYPEDKLNTILIDNNSQDESSRFFQNKYKDTVDLVSMDTNLGFIKGNNYGIKMAIDKNKSEYVLLLNNDIEIIHENWLKKLVTVAKDSEVGIVGPKLIFPNGRIQWSARKSGDNIFYLILQTLTARMNPGFGEYEVEAPYANFIGEANTISGACMLIKSDVIKDIGMLDVSLYPMYNEDVEFSFRAWEHGYKVVYRGDVNLIHHESFTINQSKLKKEKFYLALRNSVILNRRYMGFVRTLMVGLPIFLFVSLFDKKDENLKLKVSNMRLKENIITQLLLFLECSKYIFVKKEEKIELPP